MRVMRNCLAVLPPLHNCIDNIIHTNAGIQARLDCNQIMHGDELPNGEIVVTAAYNLPSRYIFHTVGPTVQNHPPNAQDQLDLANCYINTLNEMEALELNSVAFCCISTGVYGYPQTDACQLAVTTVRKWLSEHNSNIKVIFNVFLDKDKALYAQALSN